MLTLFYSRGSISSSSDNVIEIKGRPSGTSSQSAFHLFGDIEWLVYRAKWENERWSYLNPQVSSSLYLLFVVYLGDVSNLWSVVLQLTFLVCLISRSLFFVNIMHLAYYVSLYFNLLFDCKMFFAHLTYLGGLGYFGLDRPDSILT